jgi:hypothetical protein
MLRAIWMQAVNYAHGGAGWNAQSGALGVVNEGDAFRRTATLFPLVRVATACQRKSSPDTPSSTPKWAIGKFLPTCRALSRVTELSDVLVGQSG